MQKIYGMALMLAPVVLATPASAQDQADTGAYGAVGLTYSMMPDVDSYVDNAPAPGLQVHVRNIMNDGWGGWGAIGYDLGRFRLEGQIGYVVNKGDKYVAVDPFAGREVPQDIEQNELRVMANGYVDILDGPISPYLGAGLGLVHVKMTSVGPRLPFPDEDPMELIDDQDSRFAYQLMVGINADLGERTSITAQYRWLDAGTIEGVDFRDEGITREHRSHHIDVGIRLRF